jgi:hypothetical protein
VRVSHDGGRTWDDADAKTLTVPGAVVKAYELAADLGWRCSLTFAPGPPANVALRFRRATADGLQAGYAIWHLDDGCKFQSGAMNPLRPLPTLRDVHHHLGVTCEHDAALLDCIECARERAEKAAQAAAKRAATKAAKAAA